MAKKTKPKVGVKVPTLNEISKRYGSSIIMNASTHSDNGLWIPSSFYALNDLMGGGIPFGKIIEVAGTESSGKSLVAYDFARSTQKLGGHVIWIDAEQAWQNGWAEINGLDLNKVTVLSDTQVEVISDAIADLAIYYRSKLQSNEPILIVLDSIAALDCMDAINAKMMDGKAEMGSRAKAIYKMFRIRNELLYKLGATMLAINQVRTSLNTGFGQDPSCLHYDTNIPFVDGTSMKIGDIVKNKVTKEVWSFNEDKQIFEPKPITGWVKKEPTEVWYRIKTKAPGSKNGVNGITCTDNHYVLTDKGWKAAQDIKEGDLLITKIENRLNPLSEVLAGTLVGDCSIRNTHKKGNTSYLTFKDSINPDYVEWKTTLIYPILKLINSSEGFARFEADVELGQLYHNITNKHNMVSHLKVWEILKPSWLSLAIWYMDDGHLSKENTAMLSFSEKRTLQSDMISYLHTNFNLQANRANVRNIRLTKDSSEVFFKNIQSYIPQCMQYKLPEENRGFYEKQKVYEPNTSIIPLEAEVIQVDTITSGRTLRKPHKYDITVKDNHNFLAGNTNTGVVVHNTTPGGAALKFYASIRLQFFGGKALTVKHKGKDRKVGKYVTVRVLKNKVAPPKATISKAPMYFTIKFGNKVGFDACFGLEDVLYERDILEKTSSGVFKLNGETLARGEEKFKELIESNDKLRRKLLTLAEINTISTSKKKLRETEFNLFPVDGEVEYDSQLDSEDNEDTDE